MPPESIVNYIRYPGS